MSRRNAVASSGEPCFSSQTTWPIILSRRSHNARTNTAACAASRSPIEEVSQLVPDSASHAPRVRIVRTVGRWNHDPSAIGFDEIAHNVLPRATDKQRAAAVPSRL
jgi:hypothetical protein